VYKNEKIETERERERERETEKKGLQQTSALEAKFSFSSKNIL
jgi:hypothetical protein